VAAINTCDYLIPAMVPYWLLFLIFAAGALAFGAVVTMPQPNADAASQLQNRDRQRHHWWERLGRHSPLLPVAALVPAVMIGLRYHVGTDWNAYVEIFKRLNRPDFLSALAITDPGYAALNWFAHAANAGIWLVNLICGLLFMFGVVRFVRVQPNPWLALLVAIPYLVIAVGMGYSRQAVAIGLCMAGLASLSRGSFIRFMMWTLAAASFHRTAVILIPIVAVAYSSSPLQRTATAAFAFAVSWFLLTRGEAIEHFQQAYMQHAYAAQGAGIRLAMNLPPALIFIWNSKRFTGDETERRVWRNFAVLAILSFVTWFGITSTVALDRMSLYLIPLQLFVFSRIPHAFSDRDRSALGLVLPVILYSAVVQLVWLNFSNNAHAWIPYRFYPFAVHA
jgi:hypothetical protein